MNLQILFMPRRCSTLFMKNPVRSRLNFSGKVRRKSAFLSIVVFCLLRAYFVNSVCYAQDTTTFPGASEKQEVANLPPALNTDADDSADAKDEYKLVDLPPLKRLVLYNSGVGQLQHSGVVDGKTRLQIRFGLHDVDDVLRSLMFEDRGKGTVRAVEYQPAPEPEDVAADQIGQPMTLAQLLQRFRGEAISIVTSGSTIDGTIYGVENRARGDDLIETLILMHGDGLRSVELNRIDRMQFTNETIQKELKLAMSGLVKSRKANQKQLDLLLDGEGERPVQFAYVVDMPIWRMTYRIAINEDTSELQGWAHVDNVTGVDWENVTMELRSGKPQAFHANIFAPIMAARPEVGTSVFEFTKGLALIGDLLGSGFGGGWSQESGGLGGGGFGGSGGGTFGGAPSRNRDSSQTMDVTSAFKSTATEGRASQMVRYVLDSPVSLGAGKSAALPVFSSSLPSKKLSVYTDGEDSVVFRALQLTNETKLPLVSGPVSIIGDGDFVGDGSLPRLNADEQVEVIYGVDRAVEVERKDGRSKKTLTLVEIDKGKIKMEYTMTWALSFHAENKDTEQRDLLVRFAVDSIEKSERDTRELVFNPAPQDNEYGVVTYLQRIEAQSDGLLEIEVTRDFAETQTLGNTDKNTIRNWQKSKVTISESDLKTLSEFAEIDESIRQIRTELGAIMTDRKTFESEQARVRQNLEAVAASPEAAKVYLDQLQSLEKEIQSSDQRAADAQKRLAEVEKTKQEKLESYDD